MRARSKTVQSGEITKRYYLFSNEHYLISPPSGGLIYCPTIRNSQQDRRREQSAGSFILKKPGVLLSESRLKKIKMNKNTIDMVYCIQSTNKIHKKLLDFVKILVYYLFTYSTDISDA